MEDLNIKRHTFHFKVIAYFFFPLLGLLGIYFFYLLVRDLREGIYAPISNIWLILGIVLCAGSVYLIYHFFKLAPHIRISGDHILFNNREKYKLDDIKHLELDQLLPAPSLNIFEKEMGLRLIFKNNKVKRLYDVYYENLPELQTYLQVVLEQKQTHFQGTIEPPPDSEVKSQDYRWFRRPLLKSRELSTIGILLFMVGIAVYQYFLSGVGLLSFIFFSIPVFLYLMLINRTHYFGLSDKHFRVKNPLKRAANKAIYLKDIQKMVLVKKGAYQQLVVVFKDHSLLYYPSGILKKREWEALEESCREKGILFETETPIENQSA